MSVIYPLDASDRPGDDISPPNSCTVQLQISTIQGSVLHAIAMRRGGRVPLLRAYLIAAAITYLPMILAAVLGDTPMITRTDAARLPFLRDWNVAFMFLVSFPSIVVLLVSDDAAIRSALARVQQDGVVVVPGDAANRLVVRWGRMFRIINIFGYSVGGLVGIIVALFNYVAYAREDVGYWIAANGRLLFSGDVFLACVFLFYGVIPLVVCRTVGMSLFLRDLVANTELRLLPFHPDKCGGLRPVGRLGLRTQYVLTMFGLNLVSLVAISILALKPSPILYAMMTAGSVAYLVVGPIVFMGPLLPFRAGMLRAKSELMGEVAQRLRVELQRLRRQLPSGPITKDDEELIDRLRKLGSVVDELPVWPFDAGTLRRFVTAYVLPLAGAVGYPLLSMLAKRLGIVSDF